MGDDDEYLEDDDFFAATFLSIPDSELVDSSISEHSTEIDWQQKHNIIDSQIINAGKFVAKQESKTLKLNDFISSCPEKERLEENVFNTSMVSSTPVTCINEQKANFIRSLDEALKGSLCPKYNVECSSSNNKEKWLDVLKVNIKAQSCAKSDISVKQKIETESCHHDSKSYNTKLIPRARKSWKRKFCGPAGLVPDTQDETMQPHFSGDIHRSSSVMSAFDFDEQDIVDSQYTPEALQCGPWETLQADVSSSLYNFSSSQSYNIRRILKEASKKRLPKYLVIPILFILIKKLDLKKDSTEFSWPIFMDETGEMNGKISKEVLEKYEKEIVEGSAVILRNVKSLCNVLIMNCENLVTIYAANGTIKHLQDLNSVLEADEDVSDKQIVPPKVNTFNRLQSFMSESNTIAVEIHEVPLKASGLDFKNRFKNQAVNISNSHSTAWTQNVENNHSTSVKKISSESENVYSSDCLDDFDELLGNLDESSFLGD